MATPDKDDKPRFVPASSRRNFRLSSLEMLIVALIVLGVAYLVSMWVGSAFTPEPEAAAPAATGPLMEKALVASEKAQAQLSSLVNDLGSMRKDIEELRARRASAAPGQPAPHSDALDRRLDDLEKQVKAAASHKEDKTLATLAQDLKALAGRLERLEKEQAAKPPETKTAAAPAAPAAALDPKILARLERLEQAQARPPAAAPAPDLSSVDKRLDKLEQGLSQLSKDLSRTPSAAPAPLAAPEPAAKPVAAASTPEPKPEAKRPPKVAAKPAPSKPPADHRKVTHKVRPGETLLGLARKYKVSHDDIVRWNASQLGDRRQLLIGETLVIIPGNNS